ncbi:MAG: HEAT repeat domain-containing protein [Pseudomonadota bacterium]|nr:HEAT repeat domain-containing protein [Pseudomonadota bacterium]
MLLLLLACEGGGEAPVVRPLAEGAGPEVCAQEPFEQLRIGCLVESAARAGREGDPDRAEAACAALPAGAWLDECHFRAGEELGRAGKVVPALAHCGRAGRFATFCTTHVGWGIPPLEEPLATWLSGVPALPDELEIEAADTLRARWWFNRYFGTGTADPALAQAAPPDELPHARGAWALEAIRLADGDLPAARAAWTAGTVLTGPILGGEGRDRRLGRYDAPFKIAGEDALPRIPTFGGGRRFVGETPDEDLDLALVEGLYFRERTGAAAFRPFLADPRPRVRYTALRCYRTLPSPDAEAVLSAMAQDADPIVAAHVADALKYRTWKGKPNAPGLR